MADLAPDTVVAQAGDVVTREIAGQLVLLTPTNGKIHELDEVGCFLWGLCAKPVSIESMTDMVTEEYEVERDVASNDIISFINELIDAGAVKQQ